MSSGALPLVSVVVPVHDDPDGIRRCLTALGTQDYPLDRVQVLVCDNASTRPVGDLSGPHGDRLRVEVLTESVPGSYRARNRCLLRAEGEVLAFTDADCTPDRQWLARGVDALVDHDLAAGRVAVYSSRTRPRSVEVHEMVAAFPQEKYVRQMHFGVTANLFVRRSVVDDLGPFVEDLTSGGDREFCSRAVAAGRRLVYAPDAVVGHPARASVREIWDKARRVRRGAFEERGLPLSTAGWVRRLVPPLGALARSRDVRVPTGARWRYVVGETVAHYVSVAADLPYVVRRARGPAQR